MDELLEENQKSHFQIPQSNEIDIIDRKQILVKEPILELGSELCKYYKAKDIDTGEDFFAIVIEKHHIYPISILEKLKGIKGLSLVQMVTYGITQISLNNESHLVVIVEKFDYSFPLSRKLIEEGPLSLTELQNKLILPLVKILEFCEKNEIELGLLNSNHIIVNEKGEYILREFYCFMPHYFLSTPYLAPEITGTVKFGRITGNLKADLYSLGILAFVAATGDAPWINYTEEEFNIIRLEAGSFTSIASKAKIENYLKPFLKGLLLDKAEHRWTIKNIREWLDGKAGKSISADPFDAVTPVIFDDKNFQNCKALAYYMHLHWDNACNFMREDRLTKWVHRSLNKGKTSESLNEILNENNAFRYSLNYDKDSQLAKFLATLDPVLLMRTKNLCITFLSIPYALVASIALKRNDYVDKILQMCLKGSWDILAQRVPGFEQYISYIKHLENSVKYFNPQVTGFNIDRIIYDLLPDLPCLSSIVSSGYITSVESLLEFIDKLVAKSPQMQLIDKNMIGYIASKLELKKEVKIASLKSYPSIASSSAINAVSYFYLAYQKLSTPKLEKLTSVLANRIIELMDQHLHNVNLKSQLSKSLTKSGLEGDLASIIKTISDIRLLENDYIGYRNACREVASLTSMINSLKDKNKVSNIGLYFGQRITVLFSYFAILAFTIILSI